MKRLRAWWHLLSRQPHDWQLWARLQDGERPGLLGPIPNVLIVERCAFQPWCRAVRSFDYQAMVPDSVVADLMNQLTAPNPYRTVLLRPNAVTNRTPWQTTFTTTFEDAGYVPDAETKP